MVIKMAIEMAAWGFRNEDVEWEMANHWTKGSRIDDGDGMGNCATNLASRGCLSQGSVSRTCRAL